MVRIGKLRYDVTANTSDFQKGMVATRRELSQARRVIRDTQDPMDRYNDKMVELTKLHAKGVISTKTFSKATRKIKDDAALAAGGVKSLMVQVRRMPGAFKAAAAAFLGIQTARSAISSVAGQLSEIDQIAKAADKLGVATNELVGLQLAAEEFSGFGAKQFQTALQRMTRRVAEAANGTGEARGALKELGVDAAALNQAGPAEAFRMIADAIKGVEQPADQLRLAFKLFDSEGAGLVSTLRAGSDGLLEMQTRAEQLGITFSDDMANDVEAANDAIGEAKHAMSAMARSAAIVYAPAIMKAAEAVEAFAGLIASVPERGREFGEWIAETAAKLGFIQQGADVRVIGNTPGTMAQRTPGQDIDSEIEAMRKQEEAAAEAVKEQEAAGVSILDKLRKETQELEKQERLRRGQREEMERQEAIREGADLTQLSRLQQQRQFFEQMEQKRKEMMEKKREDEAAAAKAEEEKAKFREEADRSAQATAVTSGSVEEFRLLANLRKQSSGQEEKRHQEQKQELQKINENSRVAAEKLTEFIDSWDPKSAGMAI